MAGKKEKTLARQVEQKERLFIEMDGKKKKKERNLKEAHLIGRGKNIG